jgi:hypothetical protein
MGKPKTVGDLVQQYRITEKQITQIRGSILVLLDAAMINNVSYETPLRILRSERTRLEKQREELGKMSIEAAKEVLQRWD